MISPTTRIILVRHGRSTFNDQGCYQGSSNSSVLTEKGMETARLVGTYLKQRFCTKEAESNAELPIDFIYTSPLRRVQKTAEAISQELPSLARPPVIVSPDLKEISLSLWEGLPYDYVKQKYSQEYAAWQQRPEMFELPVSSVQTRAFAADSRLTKAAHTATELATKTYFPVRDLYQAAQKFWHTVLPQHPGRTLLIVSHSGTIHALISTALGLSPKHHHSLQQSNCGISELTFCPKTNGRNDGSRPGYDVQLHQLNQTSAIGEKLPKIKTTKKGLRLLLLPSDNLTVGDCKRLAQRIQSLPLDFCIAAGISFAKLSALMRGCPNVMYIEAKSAGFLQTWQQQLVKSPRPAEPLMTALAIAPTSSIQKLLLRTLSHHSPGSTTARRKGDDSPKNNSPKSDSPINHIKRNCIHLRPHHLSVVHYPYQHRPVVQAINTFANK